MLVKNVWDNEGKTFAVPDHILEDFEIAQAVSAPELFSTTRQPSADNNGNGNGAHALGGWDSALTETYNNSSVRSNSQSSNRSEALNALSGFLGAVEVDCTLGGLVPALGLRSILVDPTSPHSDTLFMGGYAMSGYNEDSGSRGWDDNSEVHRILRLLENPALANLPVRVTLADIHRLRSRLSA